MVVKAMQYYQEIHAFILKQDDERILMDAGERTTLLNKILTDLRAIKALAATSCYRVRWAVKNGIINTLNPFSSFVNRDARIVQDILKKWQY
jgi:phosphopantetheine adenylyltransferase